MTDILGSALIAHQRGWTPVPIKPQRKSPIAQDWPKILHETPDAVTSAWTDAAQPYGDQPLNLGLALGALHGGLVDIDIDHHKALVIASNLLPETAMRSGRPGRPGSHFWYRVEGYDPGLRPHKLPDGTMVIEYRASGAQTVVPPSWHPDGESYEWAGEPWGGADGPRVLSAAEGLQLHATVLLIALLVTLADEWPKRGGRHAAYLPLVGGLLRDADEHGEPRLHPFWNEQISGVIHLMVALTNDADGPMTRINESVETTRKKILTDRKVQGWPTLAQIIGDDHVKKAREYVQQIESLLGVERGRFRRSDDDEATWVPRVVEDHEKQPETSADRDLRVALLPYQERDPLSERLNEWEPVDLRPYVLGDWQPPQPTLLTRDDGQGLIYPGRVNMLYGEGGSGKTLIALDLAREVIESGERVLFVDMEDEPINTVDRFRSLGLPDEKILGGNLAYMRPLGDPLGAMHFDRWGQQVRPASGERESDAMVRAVLDSFDPTLILIDGTTTLYRIHGLDTNGVQGTDIVGGWLRWLTNNNRRTVLLIDHTSKNAGPESGPIGSQHKIAMVQGVALRVKAALKPRRGGIGHAALLVGKDRLGVVMGNSSQADVPVAAEVTFDNQTDPSRLRITYAEPNIASTPSIQVVDNRADDMLAALQRRAGDLDNYATAWMSPREIRLAASVDADANTTTRLLQDLLDAGLVEHNAVRAAGSKYRALLPNGVH